MANPEHVEILKQGVEVWNKWREENPKEIPNLSECEISPDTLKNAKAFAKTDSSQRVELYVVNFSGANLNQTKFYLCNLDSAYFTDASLDYASFNDVVLRFANFSNASLRFATFEKADFLEALLPDIDGYACKFEGCEFGLADFTNAKLSHANFSNALLPDVNLIGANLSGANFENANVSAVKFSRNTRKKHFQGIRVSTCYGSQRFKSFARDQDFIEELRDSGKWGERIFKIWWLFADCGRSFLRWAGWSLLFALSFAALFFFILGPESFKFAGPPADSFQTMIYYSVVTFTTLGFGDVTPVTSGAMWAVMAEVVLGYIMLGGLISILANKLARRS